MSAPMKRLGECCEVVSGATPRTDNDAYWGGEILWATPKDVSGLDSSTLYETPDKLTEAGYQSCSTKLVPPGSVLVSSRAPIGLVAIAGVEMCTNQGFKTLVPGPELNSNYLYHCMRASADRLALLGNGATFKEVSKTTVENFEIPVPQLEAQIRIAAVLDKADSLRRKRQEAIGLADEFLRAVFFERFSAKPRSRVLTDYCDFLAGFAFKSDQYIEPRNGVRLLRGINVGIDRFEWSDSAGYPLSAVSDLARYRLNEGDVVLAMDRPWISTGLKCAVVDEQAAGSYLVQRVARLRPKQQGMSAFIMNCLQGSDFKRHCRITETTIPHISPKDFATFPVPTATDAELRSFAVIAAKIQRVASKAVQAAISADELTSSLQATIFNTH